MLVSYLKAVILRMFMSAKSAYENHLLQVAKSPVQTHNRTGLSYPLHPTLGHLQNHTMTTS